MSRFAPGLGLALALTALLSVSDALAARVVLLQFGGRKGDVIRERVAQSLKDAGHSVVLSKTPSEDADSARLSRIAKKARADVVVTGSVRRHSMRLWSATLRASDGEGGEPLGKEVRFRNSWLPGLSKDLTDKAASRLEPAFELAGASSSEPAEPVEEDPPRPASDVWDADDGSVSPTQAEASESDGSTDEAASDSLFEVDAGVLGGQTATGEDRGSDTDEGAFGTVAVLRARGGMVHRTIDFSDDLYDRLRTQSANIWVYQVDAAIYPFERPIGERLGVIASFESVFSGNVRDVDFGNNFPVVFQELFGGLRARHPIGGENEVGFDLTFGRMLSGLEDQNNAAQIPDMDYTLLRAKLDFMLDLGQLKGVGSAGFRLPLGYGEVGTADWFPRVGGYGYEVAAGLEYPVSKRMSLEFGGSLRRYLLEMNSEPDDAIDGIAEVAGGAVDLYLSAHFGVSFKL